GAQVDAARVEPPRQATAVDPADGVRGSDVRPGHRREDGGAQHLPTVATAAREGGDDECCGGEQREHADDGDGHALHASLPVGCAWSTCAGFRSVCPACASGLLLGRRYPTLVAV